MTLGTGFDFTAEQFELLCSDIGSVPLSFAVTASSAVPLLLSPITVRNYADACPASGERPSASFSDDYRSRLLREQQSTYRDAAARPYIHLVDGGLSDNLGVRRLLDRALSNGAMGATFNEVRIAPGSIKRLVLIVVNAERDPAHRIDESDRVPSTAAVVDALLFGAGNHATDETQAFLSDVARRWQEDLRQGRRDRFAGFAPDAEIFLITVNLRDASIGEERRKLLQIPTAFTISDSEVTQLIDAGREVLRASAAFRSLRKSLGLSDFP